MSGFPKYQNNFNAGILSPYIEGRPDVAQFYNGCLAMRNVVLLPEGGFENTPGSLYITTTKDNGPAILIPFEPTDLVSFEIQMGVGYFRFRKNGVVIENLLTGDPYEISSPYSFDDLQEIQGGQGIRQVNDKIFICCSGREPRELIYGGDTNWALTTSPFDPMPSLEADTDISLGTATLTPAAVTGENINFEASDAVFLNGDVGRVIKFGLSRALIITFTDTSNVKADILVDFPDTDPIAAGEWLLEGSPGGATLNVPNKQPIGRSMTATADVATFREADVGKFIKIYGGLLQITNFSSTTKVQVKILSVLTDSDKFDPDAAPAGSWRMEVPAWSDERGWPTLNEFFQGRYVLASNANQPTTTWFSRTNSFYNFAVGALATDSLEYTHRAGTFGQMKWLKENGALFFADGFAENSMKGKGVDEPIGGDTVPFTRPESHNGSARLRPIHVGSSVLFLDWSRTKVLASAYSFDRDAQIAKQVTFLTRNLTENVPSGMTAGMDTHAPAYMQQPIPLIFWRRNGGVLLALSFNDDPEGSNAGWTTLELDGDIESYCVTRRGRSSVLSLIVRRTLGAGTEESPCQTVRYIEEIKRAVHDPAESSWTELQTQAASVQSFPAQDAPLTVPNLEHLEGKTVNVLMYRLTDAPKSPAWLGQFVVSGGEITLETVLGGSGDIVVEVGIPFDSYAKTMRATVANQPTDGRLRRWNKCMLRFEKSCLPIVNGTDMQAQRTADKLDEGPFLRCGDIFVDTNDVPGSTKWDWSLDGYVEITRSKPYPLRVLMLAGEIEFSESMAEPQNNDGQICNPVAGQNEHWTPCSGTTEEEGCTDATERGQQAIALETAFDQQSSYSGNLRTSWSYISAAAELYSLIGDAQCAGGNMAYTSSCSQVNHYQGASLEHPALVSPEFIPAVNTKMGTSDEPMYAFAEAQGCHVVYPTRGLRVVCKFITGHPFGAGNIEILAKRGAFIYTAPSFSAFGSSPIAVYAADVGGVALMQWSTLSTYEIPSLSATDSFLYCYAALGSERAIKKLSRSDGSLVATFDLTNLGVRAIFAVTDDLIYVIAQSALYYITNFTNLVFVGRISGMGAVPRTMVFAGGTVYTGGNGFAGFGTNIHKLAVACPPETGPVVASLSTGATVAAGASITVNWADVLVPLNSDAIQLRAAPVSGLGFSGAALASVLNSSALGTGSVSFPIPGGTAPGNYVFHYAVSGGEALVAKSGVFTVT